MGKALLIIVLALSTLFSTGMLNMNRNSLASVDEYSAHYRQMAARNAAVSGVYMSFSKLYQDSTWRDGFNNLSIDGSTVHVDVSTLSSWDVKLTSRATYENISDTIEVVLRMPPELGDLAIYTTDSVENVIAWDELNNEDPSLIVEHAPEMPPFDKKALIDSSDSQGHTVDASSSPFAPPKNYPNNSFYYDAAKKIPNVTYVKGGNLVVKGGTTIYGIFIVESDVIFEQLGSARVEGIIYMPNNGSIQLLGGGNPHDPNIIGGVIVDGAVDGTASAPKKIKVQYKEEYMKLFSNYQFSRNLYILSWTESHFYH